MKLLNRSISSKYCMKICSICNRVSATDQDHLDCMQRLRIELEDLDEKIKLPEKLDITKDPQDLDVTIKAVLEHLAREKMDSS